jgi:hypothetical protein
VAQRLPPPSFVQCKVTYPWTGSDGTSARFSVWVTPFELGIGPLDLLALTRTTDASGQGELEARVRGYVATGIGASHDVEVSYERHPEIAVVSFPDVLDLARLLDEALRHSRPLTASDLAAVGAEVASAIDDGELLARASATLAELTTARTNLAAALAYAEMDNSSVAARDVRGRLWQLADFGVRSAIPPGVDDENPEERVALLATARQALADADRTLAACGSAATDVARIQTAFGGDFTVLPTFVPANDVEVEAAVAHGPTIVGDARGVRRWLEGAAAVREPLAALRLAHLVGEALTATPIELQVAQFPHVLERPWAGGTFDPNTGLRPRSGTVSFVADVPFGVSAGGTGGRVAGVVFDEWSELIPAAAQDTCFAVHHDAPGAEAAQCILLAVPPTRKGPWTLPGLEAIVNETLDLAKIRAVDAEQLGALGLLAPTTFLAANLGEDAISHDLAVHTIDENLILGPE